MDPISSVHKVDFVVTDPSTASPVFEVELGPRERVERIGPYEVIGILGRGGMGIVYEVRCPDRAGHFALKTIEAQCLRADSELAQQRFSREIDVLQRVEHPSVIRMLDHGWAEHPLGYRLAYFLMEKLEGVSLKAKLQTEGPLSVADAAEIAVQLLQGLTYLEGLDLVHRDIKPANVFITDHRRVVLMDFGLARNVEDTRLTQVGRVIGTLAYMSPEALKAADVDGRADVYAVGVLLFEMLTGRPPYQGSNANAYLSASKTGMSDEDRKLLPPVVIQLLDRMLRADLRGRPYASELTAEIEAVSQSESWSQPHAGQSHAGQSHAGQSHAGQS
ncbi:MAG: serine/threonine-protein kinase, partial [Myxococcota bacterium]